MRWVRRLLPLALLLGLVPSGTAAARTGATVTVQELNFVFAPDLTKVKMGDTVEWINQTETPHTTTDEALLRLWSSGQMEQYDTFDYTFTAAGTYPYYCAKHLLYNMLGRVSIKPTAVPRNGQAGTLFTITVASVDAPTDFVYDIQRRDPGGPFQDWLTDQTTGQVTWDSTGQVPGTYQFRSRLRRVSNGGATLYSPVVSVNVTAASPGAALGGPGSPLTVPFAREGMGLAYDAARGNLVLFGGQYFGSYMNDTWVWNGKRWRLQAPATSPPPRAGAAMVYDPNIQKVILFGGRDQNRDRRDMWTWDGTNWTSITPPITPSSRDSMGAAYDAARGQVVLFGGVTNFFNYHDDTWTWDGTTWTQAAPATSPAARADMGVTYDAAHQQVVLFGGDGRDIYGDTWTWDGTNWTRQAPAASPSRRYGVRIAYDESRQQVVLFGGGDVDFYNDTWTWDGTNWTQAAPAASPDPRWFVGLEYDPRVLAVVLFGGGGAVFYGDLWTWDGANWTKRSR